MPFNALVRIAGTAALAAAMLLPSTAFANGYCPVAEAAGQEQLKERAFMSDGLPIHFYEVGEKNEQTLILMHGFMTDSRQNFGPVVPLLGRNLHLILMDVRGHGHSGKPHDAGAYGPEMAEDVIRLMDHLGIQKAHVGGFSMGGLITLYLAAHHADRLKSAVLGGFGPLESPLPRDTGPLPLALNEAIRTGDELSDVLYRQNEAYFDAPAFRYEPLRRFYSSLRSVRTDPTALSFAFNSLNEMSVTPSDAAHIKLPMLAISGDRDMAVPAQIELQKSNPNVALAMVPNCGHLSAATNAAFAVMVTDFISAIASQSESGLPKVVD